MKIDYVWTDGNQELVFFGKEAKEDALATREIRGAGKVWRRELAEDGLLEGVTLIDEKEISNEKNHNPRHSEKH